MKKVEVVFAEYSNCK